MRRFSFLHRFAAVLAGVLMLQLSLLGSGALCRMPARGHAHGHAHAVMATDEMPMNGAADCHAAMSECASVAVALTTGTAQGEVVAPAHVPSAFAPFAVLSPTFAPELPPPRA